MHVQRVSANRGKGIGNAGVGYAVFKRFGFKSDQTMKEDVYWFRV